VKARVLIGKNGEWMVTKHPRKFAVKWIGSHSLQIDSFFAESFGRY